MRTHDHEIVVYYNPQSSRAKKVLALARTVSPHVHEIEYHKSPFSSTNWQRVLEMLALRPKDIMNRAHPYYQEHIRGRDFTKQSWINILIKNPDLIKAPIAIKGSRAVLCNNPTDIYQLS